MKPCRLALLVTALVAAFAQAEVEAAASVSGGGAARTTQANQGPTLEGGSAPVFRLRASLFPSNVFGVVLEGGLDAFDTRVDPAQAADAMLNHTQWEATRIHHTRWDVRAAAALRAHVATWLTLSGSLGVSAWRVPGIRVDEAGTISSDARPVLGASLQLNATIVAGRIELGLSALGALGSQTRALSRVLLLSPELTVAIHLVRVESLTFSLLVDYRALAEAGADFNGLTHHFTGGLRVALNAPQFDAPRGPSTLQSAVWNVRAEFDGPTRPTLTWSVDGAEAQPFDGESASLDLKPGPHSVELWAPGFRPARREVTLTAGGVVSSTITLEPKNGPGALEGLVTAAASGEAVAGVSVVSGERVVLTDANGHFTLEPLGPGAVTVKLESPAFNPVQEVVQIPSETTARLDVKLERLGTGTPATVRGLIRSAKGQPLAARVVVKGQSTTVNADAEGRFVLTLNAGEYVFVISAPGYVPQSKTVTLAGGDQAIFHCELQKTR